MIYILRFEKYIATCSNYSGGGMGVARGWHVPRAAIFRGGISRKIKKIFGLCTVI